MKHWIVAIVNIHRGVNAMKTLRRSAPNGGDTKSALSALLQRLSQGRVPRLPRHFGRWPDPGARTRRAARVRRNGSGKGPAGRVRFFGSGTNAEKDRSSGNWRYTVVAGKAKWKFRLTDTSWVMGKPMEKEVDVYDKE